MTFSATENVNIVFLTHINIIFCHVFCLALSTLQWTHPKPHTPVHYTGLQTAGNTTAFQSPLGWICHAAMHCGVLWNVDAKIFGFDHKIADF